MTITVLVENTPAAGLRGAHGLSFFIQTEKHRLLFDFGPDGALLKENAAALGVDLGSVDTAVLSHGHNDHAGGLEAFLQANHRAVVHAHRLAFLPHLSIHGDALKDISADGHLQEAYPGRIRLTEGVFPIDDDLILFSDITGDALLPGANGTLFERSEEGDIARDRFLHEQNLLIREGDRLVLAAGCAHRGIVNILRRAAELGGRAPDAVIAGFHLTNPGLRRDEPEALIRAVGTALKDCPSRYCTGHCTGEGPYGLLREMLGDRIDSLYCGKTIEI